MHADTPLIDVRQARVCYGPVEALAGVDLAVHRGRVCGVIGVNGAGKSTLMRAILGLAPLAGGAISVDGLDASRARRQRRIAYVPQADAIDPTFPIRVRDVVATGRYGAVQMPRRLRQADRDAVADALEAVELSALATRQIGTLSGGQRRRMFLARALVQQAPVLLLDEPFTGVDVGTQDLVIDRLRRAAEAGVAVVVSTHDLGSLATMCDDLLLLNRTPVAHGAVSDVLTEENLMSTFRVATPTNAGPDDE